MSSESSFKVVDKRRFSESGEKVEASDVEQHFAESQPSAESVNASAQEQKPELSFSLFVQSLAHQAFMGMGLAPWPDSGLIQANYDLAREMIDLLGILEKKTKGNLDAEEAHLMEAMLYQLRMTFVKVMQEPPTTPQK